MRQWQREYNKFIQIKSYLATEQSSFGGKLFNLDLQESKKKNMWPIISAREIIDHNFVGYSYCYLCSRKNQLWA